MASTFSPDGPFHRVGSVHGVDVFTACIDSRRGPFHHGGPLVPRVISSRESFRLKDLFSARALKTVPRALCVDILRILPIILSFNNDEKTLRHSCSGLNTMHTSTRQQASPTWSGVLLQPALREALRRMLYSRGVGEGGGGGNPVALLAEATPKPNPRGMEPKGKKQPNLVLKIFLACMMPV